MQVAWLERGGGLMGLEDRRTSTFHTIRRILSILSLFPTPSLSRILNGHADAERGQYTAALTRARVRALAVGTPTTLCALRSPVASCALHDLLPFTCVSQSFMDSIVPSLITGRSPLVVPLEPEALLVASDSNTRLNATPKTSASQRRKDGIEGFEDKTKFPKLF